MPQDAPNGDKAGLEQALSDLVQGIAEGVKGEFDHTNEKVDKVGEDLNAFRKEVNEKFDRPLLTSAASKRLVAVFKRTLKGKDK